MLTKKKRLKHIDNHKAIFLLKAHNCKKVGLVFFSPCSFIHLNLLIFMFQSKKFFCALIANLFMCFNSPLSVALPLLIANGFSFTS